MFGFNVFLVIALVASCVIVFVCRDKIIAILCSGLLLTIDFLERILTLTILAQRSFVAVRQVMQKKHA